MQRFVYLFKEGKSSLRKTLGLKGSQLCEMYRMGLPIPPGLVVSTDACSAYYSGGKIYPEGLEKELMDKLGLIEASLGKKLGCAKNPLLVSVRAGAERQMPGLLASCCNVGLNDRSVIGLARKSTNERFAWDTYLRFIEDFSKVCLKVHRDRFVNAKTQLLQSKKVSKLEELHLMDYQNLVEDYMKIVNRYGGRAFPQNPEEQLWMSIDAIYHSWMSEGSIAYRRTNDLQMLTGTGVTVQTMVFGNFNQNSGAGRVFSRNPLTGEKKLYGEYMMNCQGEEMMGGRTLAPNPIEKLKEENPAIYKELANYAEDLELHFKDMQDTQFTIMDGKLFLLYSKHAKRTPTSALKVAADMVKEGKCTESQALLAMNAPTFKNLLYHTIDPTQTVGRKILGKGIPGSLCATSGIAVFDSENIDRIKRTYPHTPIIFFSRKCSSQDYVPLTKCEGYVSETGSPTADFAILAKDMGKSCILSCKNLKISNESAKIGDHQIKEGDTITIDGYKGIIYEGAMRLAEVELPGEYNTVMNWADLFTKMELKINSSLHDDLSMWRKMGAEGIGLFRTEDCYRLPERVKCMQKAIFHSVPEDYKKDMNDLAELHKEDIKRLLIETSGPSLYHSNARYFSGRVHSINSRGTRNSGQRVENSSGNNHKQLQEQIKVR